MAYERKHTQRWFKVIRSWFFMEWKLYCSCGIVAKSEQEMEQLHEQHRLEIEAQVREWFNLNIPQQRNDQWWL